MGTKVHIFNKRASSFAEKVVPLHANSNFQRNSRHIRDKFNYKKIFGYYGKESTFDDSRRLGNR